MTPIERLKELHEKATPGPWLTAGEDKAFVYALDCGTNRFWAPIQSAGPNRADRKEIEAVAGLMVATRNLLPELIALWEAVNVGLESASGKSDRDLLAYLEGLEKGVVALNSRAEEVLK